MTYLTTNHLPVIIQKALSSIGYNRKDISVSGALDCSVQGFAGHGQRSVVVLVDLDANTYRTERGSWGGANAFVANAVDSDNRRHAMPPNGAVISATEGGTSPVYATITVHPGRLQGLLPESTERPPAHVVAALMCLDSLKSSYRQDEYDRWTSGGMGSSFIGGSRGPDRPGTVPSYADAIAECCELGLAKANKRGAVRITTAGKNQAHR